MLYIKEQGSLHLCIFENVSQGCKHRESLVPAVYGEVLTLRWHFPDTWQIMVSFFSIGRLPVIYKWPIVDERASNSQ